MFGSLISLLNFALNIHNEIMEGQYIYKYPHPAVTTDCVIFGYEPKEGLSVLLIKRGIEPFKDCWKDLIAEDSHIRLEPDVPVA